MIGRRQFNRGIAASLALPGAVGAQARRPIIGVLIVNNAEVSMRLLRNALARRRLVDGGAIELLARDADGDPGRLTAMAKELATAKVDVIVALQTPAAIEARKATQTIPIVMAPVGDPLGSGLVASLARPGGNVTGVSAVTAELSGKLVELIGEALPGARRIVALANPADEFSRLFLDHVGRAGAALGVSVRPIMASGRDGLEAAFAGLSRDAADALIVQPSLPRRRTIEHAIAARLPAVSPNRPFVDEGGLMSYAANQADTLNLAAEYVAAILSGRAPAELPVQQPSRIELVVNLATARRIGVTLPVGFVSRADEVIE